ncbi:hypothetical protein BDV93DRAFT_510778 [Ceratobasidium sp. AG-I]|nr:hypothetical protein BDV93DRAFT_513122 [Ceratobasidium sp. AG-I]KAF8600596.1 hypothetical protein BDV93DRAFT_510778 [Ceratobasidium sp. AG-I]
MTLPLSPKLVLPATVSAACAMQRAPPAPPSISSYLADTTYEPPQFWLISRSNQYTLNTSPVWQRINASQIFERFSPSQLPTKWSLTGGKASAHLTIGEKSVWD